MGIDMGFLCDMWCFMYIWCDYISVHNYSCVIYDEKTNKHTHVLTKPVSEKP